MRSWIALTTAVALVVTQVPLPASAQNAPTATQVAVQSPSIATTFKAFPSGGDALKMRIADLIIANPKLAPELVVYMRNAPDLNRAQKVAAEHGLATAADRLGIKAREACPPRARADRRDECCPDGTWRYERQADGTLRDVGCDEAWYIAAAILAVAAAVCIAACRKHGDDIVILPSNN
jgi:hypothetical protein